MCTPSFVQKERQNDLYQELRWNKMDNSHFFINKTVWWTRRAGRTPWWRAQTAWCHGLGTSEVPVVVPALHTERNSHSPENSSELVDSLKGAWRPTRGWQTNTLKIAVQEKAPLYLRKKCLPFNEVSRTQGLKRSLWFHLDCLSKFTPFIPSLPCRG